MNEDFEKVLNKAKRKSMLRIILLTLLTVIITIPLFYFVSNKIVGIHSNNLNQHILLRNSVTEPNIQIDSSVISNSSSINGEIVTNRSKNISGYIVPWDTLRSQYSLFNYNIDFNELRSGEHESSENSYAYNKQTKQKVAEFYHPEQTYKNVLKTLPNDLKLMDKNKAEVAEVAISFDTPLTWNEVKKLVPQDVTVKWLYMFGNTTDKQERSNADIYGFNLDNSFEQEEEAFKYFLDDLGEFDTEKLNKDIQNYLKTVDHSSFSDTPILGILVTGENKDLQKMVSISHLRAASVGATAEINNYIKVEK